MILNDNYTEISRFPSIYLWADVLVQRFNVIHYVIIDLNQCYPTLGISEDSSAEDATNRRNSYDYLREMTLIRKTVFFFRITVNCVDVLSSLDSVFLFVTVIR